MKEKKNIFRKKVTMKVFILFLLIANGVVLFFFFSYKKNNPSFNNPYPFIDISRSFIDQEHFFSTIEPLRKSIKESIARYEAEGYEIGFYFEYLNTGANISVNQDKRFWPASLSKMPTALTVMKKIENGDWKISNELILLYEDRNSNYGDLYKEPAGTRFTIEELLEKLIIDSDDTAHRIFIRNLSGQEFEEMISALGMADLYDNEYNITAKEYSRIFRALYTSSFLDRENSSFLLNILSKTPFDTYLQAGLPEDVLFAHKIGENHDELTFLDSGVVYVPNRPYLITVMVNVPEGKEEKDASFIMKDLSQKSYSYVANYSKN